MSTAIKLIFPICLIGIVGCISKSDPITPVDFDKYNEEFIPKEKGLTQEDVNRTYRKIYSEVKQSTVGRKLSDVTVEDTTGRKLDLSSLINELTLTCFSSTHCSWGMEALSNGLPKAIQKVKKNGTSTEVICLVVKEEWDTENPEIFDSKLNQLKSFYDKLYIISIEEAKRINVFADPTLMLVNADKVVVDIYPGDGEEGALYEYFQNTNPNTH